MTNTVLTKLISCFDKIGVTVIALAIKTLCPLVFTVTYRSPYEDKTMTFTWNLPLGKDREFLTDGRRNWRWFKANMVDVAYAIEHEELWHEVGTIDDMASDPSNYEDETEWMENYVADQARIIAHYPETQEPLSIIAHYLASTAIRMPSTESLVAALAEEEPISDDLLFEQFLAQREEERRQARLIPGTDCPLPDGMDLDTYLRLQDQGFTATWTPPSDKYAISPAKARAYTRTTDDTAPF